MAEKTSTTDKAFEKIDSLTKQVKELKAERLSKEEREIYSLLKQWTSSEEPLKLLWYLLNAKMSEDGSWTMRSSSTGGVYQIPGDLGHCPCKGFLARKHCSHIKALALRTLVEWGSGTAATDVSAYFDDDETPF